MNFKPLSNPILIVSDNPCLAGGLSRMCRDLATLCCTIPQFRVAVLGRGTRQNSKLPFLIYDYPETGNWGESYIKLAWDDFAGGDPGVIITLDDTSRRHWFANPIGLDAETQKFLGPYRNFQKWGYFPLDSTGPNGYTLSLAGQDCLAHYDRVLISSEWGSQIAQHGGRKDADWLPHGIFMDKFKIQDYPHVHIGWDKPKVYVGCVMANQSRKDYPATFECFAALKETYGNQLHIWFHTDEMVRYWNMYALAADYGVGDCIEVTQNLNDTELALRYSACDCTILPSAGEGFGYPIAESLACGTACIVTDYAGGAELVEESCRVRPIAFRVDTQHNCRRALLSGHAFAVAAKSQIEIKRGDWDFRSAELASQVDHLSWSKLSHLWEKWLLAGLK